MKNSHTDSGFLSITHSRTKNSKEQYKEYYAVTGDDHGIWISFECMDILKVMVKYRENNVHMGNRFILRRSRII